MITTLPGPEGTAVHFLSADETLTDLIGSPGDMAYRIAGSGFEAYGQKGAPAPGKPVGVWPAATGGPSGARGPGIGRPAPDSYVSGVRYSVPDYFTGAVANQAITAGQLSVTPFEVGPAGLVVNGLAVVVGTTVQAGGAATCYLALYKDDGTNGVTPKWADGPIVSGSPDLTVTGNRVATVATTLTEGRYHLAFLYVVTNPTGHTQPTLALVNAATSRHASTNINGQVKGFVATGLTALPSTGGVAIPPTTSNIPVVACRSGS